MALTYRYAAVKRADGALLHAPYIPVKLFNAQLDRWIFVNFLVDSGADSTVIPKDLAESMGLREGEDSSSSGIGGTVSVRAAKLSLLFENAHQRESIICDVLVLQDGNAGVPPLLGRNGFFESFDVTIQQHARKVVLKKAY